MKYEDEKMLIPGLVSVTFRSLSQNEIANLMCRSELKAIEWGGDVHIPVKDDPTEEDMEKLDEALSNASYLSESGKFYIASFGSYYRCEGYATLHAAAAVSIGAPNIRVWAGRRSSADADESYRALVVKNIQNLCDEMKEHGITVSTEFHGGTLTDEVDSALRLINDVERENFMTYWQPNQFRDEEYNVTALKKVLPYVSNVHVFTWDAKNRYPLEDGEKIWRKYIDIIKGSGRNHHLLLEFVKDDSVEQFYRDAEVLKSWVE